MDSTRRKLYIEIKRGKAHALRFLTHQVHFNAGFFSVPHSAVCEGLGHKVRVEFAVQSDKDIAIEGSGHACCIVVGAEQGCFVLGPNQCREEENRLYEA